MWVDIMSEKKDFSSNAFLAALKSFSFYVRDSEEQADTFYDIVISA